MRRATAWITRRLLNCSLCGTRWLTKFSKKSSDKSLHKPQEQKPQLPLLSKIATVVIGGSIGMWMDKKRTVERKETWARFTQELKKTEEV